MVFDKSKIILAMGVLAVAESILAMSWKTNDRTPKAQVARLCRIVGGLTLVAMEIVYKKRRRDT